jgi:hypothetical protein
MRFLQLSGDDHEDDEDGDGELSLKERIYAMLRSISHWNPLVLTFFISCLMIPPLVATKIFTPCFDCFDFEAAALHEMGHFMGLGHLDNIPQNWVYGQNAAYGFAGPTPGNNSYQADISHAVNPPAGMMPHRPTNFSCLDPWANVHAGVPGGAPDVETSAQGYTYRNAQMEARTQNNPLSCLMDDDLEALATLYPDCGPNMLSGAICHKVQMNIGYVRMTVYVLFPAMLALLCVVICSTCTHEFERREKQRLADMYSGEKSKHHESEAKMKEQFKEAKHRRSLKKHAQAKTDAPSKPVTTTSESYGAVDTELARA